ncbi:rutC family protein C23G10.2-like [Dermacentor albipictus]|uniref:rutC family protein C23G10.2-like n=1 Tax=Dermacentor albipictus TaxID=60249 RepID=UPI0038FD2489
MDVARTLQREVINSPRLPIVTRFSQAIRVGNTVYVSGTRGIDPLTGKVVEGGIAEQTRQWQSVRYSSRTRTTLTS